VNKTSALNGAAPENSRKGRFSLSRALRDKNTSGGQKYFPELSVDIENEGGEKVARVVKSLYIRKKS